MKIRRFYEKKFWVNKMEIKKFHRELPGYQGLLIYRTQKFFLANLKRCFRIPHFLDRETEKSVPVMSMEYILKHGNCFEYKMLGDELYRLAFRISGDEDKDYIFVIEPYILADGSIEVNIVTCYANYKTDTHKTLRVSEYARSN